MPDKSILNPIFETVLTVPDLRAFEQNINILISLVFTTRESFESQLSQYLSIAQMQAIEKLVKEKNITVTDSTNLRNFLLNIQKEIHEATVIGIHLAKDLPFESIKKISKWFNENLTSAVVLDIQIDPDILGGITLFHRGRYYDYSLRKKLFEMADREELQLSNLLAS